MRLLLSTLLPLAAAQVTAQWKTLAVVPTGPLHEHATVALSPTTLAIVGGVTQKGAVLDTLYLYSIPTNTWKKAASLPVTINHANAAVVDGLLYVLGGMTGASWAGNPKAWLYDPATDKWSNLPAMPTSEARGSAVMGVYNKTVWLASGKTGSGGESVTTVSAFDTTTQKWLTDIPAAAKNIPEGRDHGGGGIIGTKFYQLGGSLGPISNRKDTVFVLDLADLSKGWITAKGKMPTPRRGFATGIVGNKIYTFGGEGNPDKASNGVFKEVEVYDAAADSWAELAPMNIPRHGSSAATVNGSIYIPAGGTASGTPCTDAFDVYTPAS
ncbi:kelch repeat-containing protein [Echria macrotheca]|uniref:Kelch repeat-containing protein n=1 Tax=Echria macrotheca TaxID=438768 RepID=A0AAJ0B7P9_9PEZI|nr:kelch repeat-containing protein [Echria macrotheca]